MKKKIIFGAILSFVLLTGTVSAIMAKTPADIVAELTHTPVHEVIKNKQTNNKTYGEIAKDAGKLEEFRKEHHTAKKAIIKQKVKDGTLTQKQADNMTKQMDQNQANCDGTGQHAGTGYGLGNGQQGSGYGQGSHNNGQGHHGNGQGNGGQGHHGMK